MAGPGEQEPALDRVEVPAVKVRRDSGLYGYERALARGGLGPVAGADERTHRSVSPRTGGVPPGNRRRSAELSPEMTTDTPWCCGHHCSCSVFFVEVHRRSVAD